MESGSAAPANHLTTRITPSPASILHEKKFGGRLSATVHVPNFHPLTSYFVLHTSMRH